MKNGLTKTLSQHEQIKAKVDLCVSRMSREDIIEFFNWVTGQLADQERQKIIQLSLDQKRALLRSMLYELRLKQMLAEMVTGYLAGAVLTVGNEASQLLAQAVQQAAKSQ